jgi:hypothetical protein
MGQTTIGKLLIYDITGQMVNTYILQPSNNTLQIQEETLQNGIYFYRIYVNEIVVATDKLVIIK